MSKVVNVLIASVGGQGGLTLSRVIAISAVHDGKDVRTGETLGMAQRFGAVVSYVRIGDEVYSPLFGQGEAHLMLGLELNEVVRNLHYLRSDGLLITADEVKPPVSSSLGLAENLGRDELISTIKEARNEGVFIVPAKRLAVEAGNYRAMNMVLLGVANYLTNLLSDESVEKAIRELLPGRKGETSIKAYSLGKEWAKSNSGRKEKK